MELSFARKENLDSDSNRRIRDRFAIADISDWKMQVGGKRLPIQWVHDLSTSGMQVRYGHYQCYDVGDVLQVEIFYKGELVVSVPAVVRWRQPGSNFLNMNLLGIEFAENDDPNLTLWMRRKLGTFLLQQGEPSPERRSPQRAAYHEPIIVPQAFSEDDDEICEETEEVKQYRLNERLQNMKDRLIVSSVIVPFLVGYFIGFI